MYAQISKVDNTTILIESLVTEKVKKKIYPTGGNRIGTIVLDSEKNLIIKKDAVSILKALFEKACCDGSDLGDIDWFQSDDGKWNFGWIGPCKRIFSLKEKIWKAKGACF